MLKESMKIIVFEYLLNYQHFKIMFDFKMRILEFLLSLLKIVRLKKSKYMKIWKLKNFEIRIIEKLEIR